MAKEYRYIIISKKIIRNVNKNKKSVGKALFQTVVNTLGNLGFCHAAVIRSLTPIPVIGSIAGGIALNYIGSIVNSKIEFDCWEWTLDKFYKINN